MASLQERININRSAAAPLDKWKWTTREQLCLASSVSCSGDQNWMTKSCALQYGQLLENVDKTPKRRKRISESNSGVTSPSIVETPTDLILRRLTEERIQELKSEIRKEQEEYVKMYSELKNLQSDHISEKKLLEMWHEIEKQQEAQRIEEMRLENQMREREQRKQDIQRNWRTVTVTNLTIKSSTDANIREMDVQEVVPESGKSMSIQLEGTTTSQTQAPSQGTSPLLSSLLKSPTASSNTATIGNSANSFGGNAARAAAAAPTITTLLTSGSIPNPNQPALTLKSNVAASEAVQLLTRPISGPPADTLSSNSVAQSLISPSQSAPTLSMLLEKNKPPVSNINQTTTVLNIESKKNVETNIEIHEKTDSNNEEVPMDIEEDIGGTVINEHKTTTVTTIADSDEPDANEEQQLLEVFKNIGNIDELEDIDVAAVIDDEEVDFLKGVDEEHNSNPIDIVEVENRVESIKTNMTTQQLGLSTTLGTNVSADKTNDFIKRDNSQLDKSTMQIEKCDEMENLQVGVKSEKTDNSKVETISSDDSNDNIPLATVASLENKERSHHSEADLKETIFLKEEMESVVKIEDTEGSSNNETTTSSPIEIKNIEELSTVTAIISTINDSPPLTATTTTKNFNIQQKSPYESESSDVIVIPTDDESSGDRRTEKPHIKDVESKSDLLQTKQNSEESTKVSAGETTTVEAKSPTIDDNIDESNLDANQDTKTIEEDMLALPPPIAIPDTDEDSSTTDVSIVARREDKKQPNYQQQEERKSFHDGSRNDSKTGEDTTMSCSATPARPPVLRKLRDRDRSESPMIDSETTISDQHSTSQRSRRRYSSTPVIDSIPNSPASSDRDDIEAKVSKKSLMNILNALQHNRNVSVIQRIFGEDNKSKYEDKCLRPMYLQTIKKNIESGTIKTIYELQRDILLMCQNSLMVFNTNSNDYKNVCSFMKECQTIKNFIANSNLHDNSLKAEKDLKENKSSSVALNTSSSSSVVKVRGSSRKSQRISCPN